MRAVGYKKSLPIENPESLIDLEIDKPTPQGRDLLVQVKAISVNPVDYKVRKRAQPKDGEPPKILGYDAAGVVAAVGSGVTLFKPGDEVWYAGSIVRPGTNSEFHLVDERIVGGKPRSLGFAAAAALPLTSITAWEMLFDRFGVPRGGGEGKSLLIVGGAGGVGSIATQLACKLTKLVQCLFVLYNDEVPGLSIPTTGGQTARLDNFADDGFRDRCILEAAHCQRRTNRFKCFHENHFLS